ncbi:MAG: glucosamine-6-phosphate deaminase [Firmicutes bacterium HGW-Firmicutes-9]|jgi:glucosamine-6-phosphate deaminase|nr:MAG: glucosamine-6-phosphate deaminase [Firmicutes bacterium HGW-Firmicutes-9]
MKVIVTDNFEASCRIAAEQIASVIRSKPDARLGLATGSTAQGVYPYLVAANRAGELDFSRVSTINLDEYVGLAPDHPQSYRRFMDEHLFDRINIDKANTIVAKGTGDIEANVKSFREALAAKPIDVQLLGIGVDGHVGFNEPGEVLYDGAHVEELDESTIDANARFFATRSEVPTKAISMGMGDILRAKKLILLATGESKAAAMRGLLLNEELDVQNPATLVKTHPDATVIIDCALAEKIGYQE